jgi:hypothetical protein
VNRACYAPFCVLLACGSPGTPPATVDSFLSIWVSESYGPTADAAPTLLNGYYGRYAWDPLGPVVQMDACVYVNSSATPIVSAVRGIVDVEIGGAGVWSFADTSRGFGPIDAGPTTKILGEGAQVTLLGMRDGEFDLDELVTVAPGPPDVAVPAEGATLTRDEPVEVQWLPRGESSILLSIAFYGQTGEFLLAQDCLVHDTGQLTMSPWPNVPAGAVSVALRARYQHEALSQTGSLQYAIRTRSVLVRSLGLVNAAP